MAASVTLTPLGLDGTSAAVPGKTGGPDTGTDFASLIGQLSIDPSAGGAATASPGTAQAGPRSGKPAGLKFGPLGFTADGTGNAAPATASPPDPTSVPPPTPGTLTPALIGGLQLAGLPDTTQTMVDARPSPPDGTSLAHGSLADAVPGATATQGNVLSPAQSDGVSAPLTSNPAITSATEQAVGQAVTASAVTPPGIAVAAKQETPAPTGTSTQPSPGDTTATDSTAAQPMIAPPAAQSTAPAGSPPTPPDTLAGKEATPTPAQSLDKLATRNTAPATAQPGGTVQGSRPHRQASTKPTTAPQTPGDSGTTPQTAMAAAATASSPAALLTALAGAGTAQTDQPAPRDNNTASPQDQPARPAAIFPASATTASPAPGGTGLAHDENTGGIGGRGTTLDNGPRAASGGGGPTIAAPHAAQAITPAATSHAPPQAGNQSGAFQVPILHSADQSSATSPAPQKTQAPGSELTLRQTAESAGSQVALRLGRALQDGAQTVVVELHPAELGRVEVRLSFQDGGIGVQMTLDRKQTYEAFTDNRAGLEQQLTQAGIDLGNGGLDLRFGQQHSSQDAQGDAAHFRVVAAEPETAAEPEAAPPPSSSSDSLVNILA
ncbi:MAG TPA: flagellar hook-length control protein FliK [Acetobacteraceae bacterium]|nr:flagellar hook-length control protein FliK [Acetobacteraceae bacterium]